jgi:hypothetical protein
MEEMAGPLDRINMDIGLVACTLKLGLQLDKICYIKQKIEFAPMGDK